MFNNNAFLSMLGSGFGNNLSNNNNNPPTEQFPNMFSNPLLFNGLGNNNNNNNNLPNFSNIFSNLSPVINNNNNNSDELKYKNEIK